MAGLTPRDNGVRNGRAAASVLLGVLGVAALPLAVVLAEVRRELELLDAAFAIPVAGAAAIAALVLARQARRRIERTLGRARGSRSALAGRILGVIGLCLATSGTIAVATFFVLSRYAD